MMAPLVTMSTHLPYSGFVVPSMMPGISRNWRRTSSTTPASGLTNGLHQERAVEVGQKAADEKADDDHRVREVEHDLAGDRTGVFGEKDQGGKSGRTDRITLRNGLGGVAYRIQGIGYLADASGSSAISAMPPALSVIGP